MTKNTAKLDRETEELHHQRVSLEVGKVIQQGRQEKGMTQKDLATVRDVLKACSHVLPNPSMSITRLFTVYVGRWSLGGQSISSCTLGFTLKGLYFLSFNRKLMRSHKSLLIMKVEKPSPVTRS